MKFKNKFGFPIPPPEQVTPFHSLPIKSDQTDQNFVLQEISNDGTTSEETQGQRGRCRPAEPRSSQHIPAEVRPSQQR